VSVLLRIVIVLLLVLGSAVFVAAEYALITARRARLEERAANGNRGARAALRLMDEPVRFISSTQLGITIFAILVGAIGEPLISDLMEPPELFRGIAGEYLKGLTRRQEQLVVVLDVESLLASQAPLRFQPDVPRA